MVLVDASRPVATGIDDRCRGGGVRPRLSDGVAVGAGGLAGTVDRLGAHRPRPVRGNRDNRLTVDQMAQTITVYPSMSGSLAEAARRLHTSE